MIFVTTGTQAPFDRLIKIMDEVASSLTSTEIITQAVSSEYVVKSPNLKLLDFVPQKQFDQYFIDAELIVSHAGTGSIFSALTKNKPIIAFPRRASLGEHRNEHQLATARKFFDMDLLEVAFDESDLKEKVINFLNKSYTFSQKSVGKYASSSLVDSLRKQFLNGG
ncbi:MAG: glycosyltransferase [Pseudosphingobacterium sp.]|nr:glycosyl transferase family 28 [Olivibacter sp. UJ_SKK_5.1]MDX3912691.1 glycosyltransferase [Pseudosphingobacterium sp.]